MSTVNRQTSTPRGSLAYTLIEVVVGTMIMVVMFVSLYGGISAAFSATQLARENLRGTQIILERMEGIRLFNWNQLIYSNMVPTTFTNYYYPLGSNTVSKGILYFGTMTVTNVDSSNLSPVPTYTDQLRAVNVTITWTNGIVPRVRSMSTLVAQNGIQNYVFTSR